MEKNIIIDGKEVTLKMTAATPLRYKHQFQRDYFADLLVLQKTLAPFMVHGADASEDTLKEQLMNLSLEELRMIDFDVLYQLIWVMAKTANPSIPDPITWMDQYEEFPLDEIFPTVAELLAASTKKKQTNMMSQTASK